MQLICELICMQKDVVLGFKSTKKPEVQQYGILTEYSFLD